MGWLSKINKARKKIFKGVTKIASKVWKETKRFAKSDLGKAVIAAAAIYAGGAALGAWGSGAGTSAAVTELAASTIPEAAAATASTAAETAAALEAGASVGATASTAATPGLVSQVGSAVTGAGEWMAANPTATMLGGQMLSSALTPSQAETEEEIAKGRRDRSNIAGVSGTGEGSPISLGLVQQAQQQDLRAPTYNYQPGGRNA